MFCNFKGVYGKDVGSDVGTYFTVSEDAQQILSNVKKGTINSRTGEGLR